MGMRQHEGWHGDVLLVSAVSLVPGSVEAVSAPTEVTKTMVGVETKMVAWMSSGNSWAGWTKVMATRGDDKEAETVATGTETARWHVWPTEWPTELKRLDGVTDAGLMVDGAEGRMDKAEGLRLGQ
ncbi:hypothetical protein F5148DRAFT_1151907 [Russula earlei]|uniref:Uncharacterized protein n=1 Tax=Russula earlei TaxID=71964 RepID=A0ACC0TZB6_9AGAM|nr:hypothetical protein F5148DRAFT_1151907 [Russula earlei]